MHVSQIKDIVRVLTASGNNNKEFQSCVLGYIIGLEAPININITDPDDDLEWNSFLNDLSGEINEHFILNLALAQDVANLTLQYRQAVLNGADNIEELAKRFLTITGAAFGLLGDPGMIKQIRQVLANQVEEMRQGIDERREEATVREISKEGFLKDIGNTILKGVDRAISPDFLFEAKVDEVGGPTVYFTIRPGKYLKVRSGYEFAEVLSRRLLMNRYSTVHVGEQPISISAGEFPVIRVNPVMVAAIKEYYRNGGRI